MTLVMDIRNVHHPTNQDVKIEDELIKGQKLDLESEFKKIMAKYLSTFEGVHQEVEKQQIKMFLVEFFQELSSKELPNEIAKFVQDLTNNNCMGADNEKLIRRKIREKGYKMIFISRKIYHQKLIEYQFLTDKIKTWNPIRNKINIDVGYREKVYEELKLAQRDLVGVYGHDMKKLCHRIEELSHKFIQRPKGPIGACLSVHVKWCPIVEYILRPFAFTYLVDNQKDARILQELIDRIFGDIVPIWPTDYSLRPSVWITKFNIPKVKVTNCTGNVTILNSAKILTLMDIIQIDGDDQILLKFLVDYVKIERILLFKTQHDAFSILSDPIFLPKRCLLAYTLDFYKVYPHPSFRSICLAQNDVSMATTDYPNYLRHTYSSLSSMKLDLTSFQKARDELERLLRFLKDIQLHKLSNLVQLRKKLEKFQKGFELMKDVPWNQIEDAAKHVLFHGTEATANMLESVEVSRTILQIFKVQADKIDASLATESTHRK